MERKDLLTIDTALQFLVKEFEAQASLWSGDDTSGEDKAHCAIEIVEKAQELRALLDEFNDF